MKLLFVPNSLPAPPVIGGPQRTNLLLRALRRLGNVDTIAISHEVLSDEQRAELLDQYNVRAVLAPEHRYMHAPWRWFAPIHPKLIRRLAHNLGSRKVDYRPQASIEQWITQHIDLDQYDVIVGRYLYGLTRPGLIGHHPVVLDVDDLDTEVYRTRLAVPTNAKWENMVIRHHLRQLEGIVPPLLAKCDALWIANENDRAIRGLERATVLPNIPYGAEGAENITPCPADDASRTLLMIGSMSHRPNIEGADYFVEQVWPRIRATVADAKLVIVGSKMKDEQRQRWSSSPGVEAMGFVEDLAQVYEQCAFTVAPIFAGGGTNIKVIESFSRGRTCVLARPAHRGYEKHLLEGESLLVGDDAASIADACIRLLKDPALRRTMADKGLAVVRASFSFDHFAAVVARTIGEVVSPADRS
ncbi:MAG: glycosyltransferase [Planctomycetes bacterium]|nr:glycosyltransferase [Planctomycetota bacterium]